MFNYTYICYIILKNQQNLVIPNNPALAFNGLSANNANKDVYFSKEDVFKKIVNIDDEGQSTDSKKVIIVKIIIMIIIFPLFFILKYLYIYISII